MATLKPVWIKRGPNHGRIMLMTSRDADQAVADKWGSLTEIGWATPDSVLQAIQAETVNWTSYFAIRDKYQNPATAPTPYDDESPTQMPSNPVVDEPVW